MSGRRSRQIRKGAKPGAVQKPKKAGYQRNRASAYTGRLHATRVPPTKRNWTGKRGRRSSWKDVELTQIDEATDFATDRDLSDPVSVVRELKKHPQYLQPGRDATQHLYAKQPDPDNPTKMGRPRKHGDWTREQGDWLLLYLAFVLTADTSRLSFWNRYASSPVWQECGFAAQPDYEIMRLRFNELEHYWHGVRSMGR